MASIDFLDLLPDGLDTPIGERGMKLSGGQAQRIAIARALYHSPEILILDEATSALDSQTETAIQETVLSLKHKITVVLIAHRLSTVSACDEVFWLKDGAIVKRGSPDTVLPLYSRE
jgi:ABC-type multidrug transport system fused ATPase/permease subunit